MSDDGFGAAVGTFVAVGLVYWLAVGAAMVMAAVLVGVVVVGIAAVLYLIMGGIAFASAFASGDWSVVRDAILAPAFGLFVGLAFPETNRFIVYALLSAPDALLVPASGHDGAIVALITVLILGALMLLVFAFYFAGLGFGLLVSSSNEAVRMFGYIGCLAWGVTYSGTAQLIMDGTLF